MKLHRNLQSVYCCTLSTLVDITKFDLVDIGIVYIVWSDVSYGCSRMLETIRKFTSIVSRLLYVIFLYNLF